jgi:hypothetical protein
LSVILGSLGPSSLILGAGPTVLLRSSGSVVGTASAAASRLCASASVISLVSGVLTGGGGVSSVGFLP